MSSRNVTRGSVALINRDDILGSVNRHPKYSSKGPDKMRKAMK